MEGSDPSLWNAAAVKLIPKSSAQDDPSSPANFRPIALTPAISKLLSGILRNRWLKHVRLNNYLDSNLQKAFLSTIPGVSEHHAKLASIIKSTKQAKRSLAIAWLDITNAFWSVHHSLIQFSLAHYHARPQNFADRCTHGTQACQQPSQQISGLLHLFPCRQGSSRETPSMSHSVRHSPYQE